MFEDKACHPAIYKPLYCEQFKVAFYLMLKNFV